jgi:SAM-dependent methyltransferase
MSGDPWLQRWLHRVRRDASAAPVLELGCGDGRDTEVLVACCDYIVAADLDPESLRRCGRRVRQARCVMLDLAQPLPFRDQAFPVIVASLSLHYFAWSTTVAIMREIERCIAPRGTLLARVNSTGDIHYGAESPDAIEPHFHRVGRRTKRFFDRPALTRLLRNWQTDAVDELTIDRYEKPKVVWEVVARHGAE